MRTICWHVFISAAAAVGSASALAAGSAPDREISLTIYNKNIALIEHVRPISAPAGRQRIEFAGVSAQIVPETVSFMAPNVVLIEQNFDYDLLTPAKLMEKAVGSQVRLVRVNPATGAETSETARLRWVSNQPVTQAMIGANIAAMLAPTARPKTS